MTGYIVRRLLLLPVMLIVVVSLVFLIIRLGPTNPVDAAAVQVQDPEVKERIRHEFGVDRPLYVNYSEYMLGALQGDFGRSFFSNKPVLGVIAERLPATIELAVTSMLFGAVLGIGMGILAALMPNGIFDALSRSLAIAWISMPTFWLGLLFIALFTVKLGWMPATGRFDAQWDIPTPTHFYLIDSLLTGNPAVLLTTLKYLAMPAIVLGLTVAGFLTRLTRTQLLDVLRQDYVRTARSKGLRERVVIIRHGLRNAILPVVTIMGLQFGWLLGGAAVIETVFSWPGLGLLMVESINKRDYPQIQASIAVFAMGYVIVNLVVDILYTMIDPRIRIGKEQS